MGEIDKGKMFQIKRGEEETVVWEGKCTEIFSFKESVQSVKKGNQCSVRLEEYEGFRVRNRAPCYTDPRFILFSWL